jgi:hypothetical protein
MTAANHELSYTSTCIAHAGGCYIPQTGTACWVLSYRDSYGRGNHWFYVRQLRITQIWKTELLSTKRVYELLFIYLFIYSVFNGVVNSLLLWFHNVRGLDELWVTAKDRTWKEVTLA